MGFKVPQHWGILGAKISIHDRAKYSKFFTLIICGLVTLMSPFSTQSREEPGRTHLIFER